MNNGSLYTAGGASGQPSNKGAQLLRLIRASQPIMRSEIAARLSIDKSTVTEYVKPLVARGLITEETKLKPGGRRSRFISFSDDTLFCGINFGVKRSQIGITTLNGSLEAEVEFETPSTAKAAIKIARDSLDRLLADNPAKKPAMIGVSIPGMADSARRKLIFAPNLGWRNIEIADELGYPETLKVVVDNDSTAAAMFEARMKIRRSEDGLMSNFILVRSGTGIGVGLVIGSEVYRGTDSVDGVAGEFGHMTIVAGGKRCVCGNRGCWEKYASASVASSLYLGDRQLRTGEAPLRFVDIVAKAEAGEVRSRKTLEKIGDYLGIGIANVIMGVGIPRVVISGRLVYGWKFIEGPMREAIGRSIVGKTNGWSVEAGEPAGSAIGGAIELAVEEYLSSL